MIETSAKAYHRENRDVLKIPVEELKKGKYITTNKVNPITLDLSYIDTSKVTNFNWMFYEATTTSGYAKTVADANRFNNSSYKPTTLTFIKK